MFEDETGVSGTEQLYYQDAYLQECDCHILSVAARSGQSVALTLDRTIFYPEGGGQPSDQGEVITATGSVKIDRVRWHDGNILHEGKMIGSVQGGQDARAILKWSRRHKNMRVHSAGHLIHDVLMSRGVDVRPTKGNHGEKAFLEYQGSVDPGIKDDLELQVNEAIKEDLPVRTWESSYEEIMRICRFVMANLPRDKKLRVLQIGQYDAMPDGGVQVKSTREIGKIQIFHILNEDGKTTIRYGVSGPAE